MDKIAVTCLGSGAALGRHRLWSSLLLDDRILLGLPPTAIQQLYRLGKPPANVEHVLISHLHADHHFGLPFFLLLFCYLHERENPLYIIGPTGIGQASQQLFDLAWPGLKEAGVRPRVPVEYVEVKTSGSLSVGRLTVEAVKLKHFDMDAFGYRFAYKGRLIAFTGDTGPCPQLDSLLDGADVAITEFTHVLDVDDPGHLNAVAVKRITNRLREHGATILATHLSGEPAPIDGLLVCRDGETYFV